MSNIFGADEGWENAGNWWNGVTSGIGNFFGGVGDFIGDVVRAGGATYAPGAATANPRAFVPESRRDDPPAFAGSQTGPLPNIADLPGFTDITPEPAEIDLTEPTDPMMQMGMTPDEMMGYLLGGSSGGGGVDLSGYNALLDDIAARESALGGRRDENLAGIQSLYESAAAAREEDQAALEASIEAQIQSDMERQASQEASRRAAEGERFETASEARQALGADVGTSDLVGETVEQSLGRLAERALAGQQDIGTTGELARQQLQAEKSGYTSAQELATRALTNSYEDRLAQLASERAAVQGQVAQARAAARPSGPSISDKINAMGFIQSLYGGGEEEPMELPGLEGVLQQYEGIYGGDPTSAEITRNFATIADAVYGVQPETGKLFNPTQLTAAIIEANPQYAPYSSLILQLAQESGI